MHTNRFTCVRQQGCFVDKQTLWSSHNPASMSCPSSECLETRRAFRGLLLVRPFLCISQWQLGLQMTISCDFPSVPQGVKGSAQSWWLKYIRGVLSPVHAQCLNQCKGRPGWGKIQLRVVTHFTLQTSANTNAPRLFYEKQILRKHSLAFRYKTIFNYHKRKYSYLAVSGYSKTDYRGVCIWRPLSPFSFPHLFPLILPRLEIFFPTTLSNL